MPRSYRFDHFTVSSPWPQARSLRRRDKQRLAETHGPAHPPGYAPLLHPEASPQVQAMNAELQALAGSAALPPQPLPPRPEGPVLPRHAARPIGALPPLSESPPSTSLQELLDEAMRHLRIVQLGLRDVSRASGRLVSLPLEAARLAALRFRFAPG